MFIVISFKGINHTFNTPHHTTASVLQGKVLCSNVITSLTCRGSICSCCSSCLVQHPGLEMLCGWGSRSSQQSQKSLPYCCRWQLLRKYNTQAASLTAAGSSASAKQDWVMCAQLALAVPSCTAQFCSAQHAHPRYSMPMQPVMHRVRVPTALGVLPPSGRCCCADLEPLKRVSAVTAKQCHHVRATDARQGLCIEMHAAISRCTSRLLD